ncbi:hypothetical protein [Oligoflexus tunisiensis]|uniref:hypothetical protein n=1 Tax=Oligoflexus tunisiensis TaxID=708132 RepID=UPI00114CFCAC|nr:hypothetical protein [Oligoflexus tunisiensis]
MRAFIISLFVLCASSVFAGIGTGGGTPPAMQDALAQLMTGAPGDGGLFLEKDYLGLAVKGDLKQELTVYRAKFAPQSIRMSEVDFSTLSERKGNIDAVNLDGLNRSYTVEDGQSLDTLILKDRRELIRDAVNDTSQN